MSEYTSVFFEYVPYSISATKGNLSKMWETISNRGDAGGSYHAVEQGRQNNAGELPDAMCAMQSKEE